jgi:hypothetical protein
MEDRWRVNSTRYKNLNRTVHVDNTNTSNPLNHRLFSSEKWSLILNFHRYYKNFDTGTNEKDPDAVVKSRRKRL